MAEINGLVVIDHFKKLSREERVVFRDNVLDCTGMAMATFYGKITGKFKFTKAELTIISNIIENYAAED